MAKKNTLDEPGLMGRGEKPAPQKNPQIFKQNHHEEEITEPQWWYDEDDRGRPNTVTSR